MIDTSRPMIDTSRFLVEVRSLAQGTPYVVKATDDGFDVRVDVADAQWYALVYKEGLRKIFTHHVALDEAKGSYTVTDDAYDLEWQPAQTSAAASRPPWSGFAQDVRSA